MDYPMHEKLRKVEAGHQWCSEFYEYLAQEGAVLEELAPMHLAGFFEIDRKAFAAEEIELIKAFTPGKPKPQPRPTDS